MVVGWFLHHWLLNLYNTSRTTKHKDNQYYNDQLNIPVYTKQLEHTLNKILKKRILRFIHFTTTEQCTVKSIRYGRVGKCLTTYYYHMQLELFLLDQTQNIPDERSNFWLSQRTLKTKMNSFSFCMRLVFKGTHSVFSVLFFLVSCEWLAFHCIM